MAGASAKIPRVSFSEMLIPAVRTLATSSSAEKRILSILTSVWLCPSRLRGAQQCRITWYTAGRCGRISRQALPRCVCRSSVSFRMPSAAARRTEKSSSTSSRSASAPSINVSPGTAVNCAASTAARRTSRSVSLARAFTTETTRASVRSKGNIVRVHRPILRSSACSLCTTPMSPVLQCVAVWCSVLRCGAVCCSVKTYAVCCTTPMSLVLQYGAVWCSVLQCVAVWCSVVQCLAVSCSVLQCVAVCCSVSQCVATCCSVLQCVARC